jgi:16S rRNA (cytidine1402-2'-O)-methyltransferase
VGKPRGRLDIVATPIGNLGDLSPRAKQALAEADIVAAEDTRHTLGLLQSIGVARPLVSLHEHNETRRVPELLARLEDGAVVALVSDAGTPLLSDPGFELVSLAARAGIEVRAIPGPSAITAALAVAGLPTDRFCFEGFLPARARERRERLAALVDETRTLVFFEAPHRIAESLADLAAAMGSEREAVIAREITKAHETIYRGTLAQLAERAQSEANLARGEITLVVHGASPAEKRGETLQLERVAMLLAKELPPGKAAALAAQITGTRRSDAYALIVGEVDKGEVDKGEVDKG